MTLRKNFLKIWQTNFKLGGAILKPETPITSAASYVSFAAALDAHLVAVQEMKITAPSVRRFDAQPLGAAATG